MVHFPTQRLIVASCAALLACAVVAGGCYLRGAKTSGPASGDAQKPAVTPTSAADLPTAPIGRPKPPSGNYVGSAACAKCHDEICHTFAEHPMGRSAALTPGPADIEDFSPERAQFEGKNDVSYRVEKVGNRIMHHEMGMNEGSRLVYDQAAPVTLAIGSGTRGKSYGINRDGLIFMSPISWYARQGGYFQLSPGYERGSNNPRFDRRLPDACLNCHTGRMVPDPQQPDRLAPPYFHEVSIGCERCHGPGQEHVRRQESLAPPVPDDSIVNPAKLSLRKREAVCNQCHLHGEFELTRFGRKPYDFRPGMELEEVFLVFTGDKGFDETGRMASVSQVGQMRDSACFKGSGGKLGCVSCHNPHEKETPANRVEFYRSKCLACHADRGCSLPIEKQYEAPASGSCIHCHMPSANASDVVHASQTDHRVLRDPSASPLLADRDGETFDNWKLFDGAQDRIPPWELRRARGLALIYAASRGKASRGRLREAEELLLPLTKVPVEDSTLYYGLGQSRLQQEQYREAVEYLEEAVRLDPHNDVYLETLARTCSSLSRYDKALVYLERTLSLNPWHARNYVLQAELLASLGDRQRALAAAEKAFTLDPTQRDLQNRINELLRGAGR